MTGVVIPNAKGGLVWIHGVDSNGEPVKLLATDPGILYTTFAGIPDTDERIVAYGGTVAESLANESLSSGTNTLTGTTVPASIIWNITTVCIRYDGTTPDVIQIFADIAGNVIPLLNVQSPTSAYWYLAFVNIWLAPDDGLRGRVVGATAGDALYFRYCGKQQAL